ncbi:hypothetical protein BN1708_019149, partial [Verticillium longisporum]
RPQAHLCSGW